MGREVTKFKFYLGHFLNSSTGLKLFTRVCKSGEVCFLRTPGCMPHSRCFVGSALPFLLSPSFPPSPPPRLCRTPAWRFHPHRASYTGSTAQRVIKRTHLHFGCWPLPPTSSETDEVARQIFILFSFILKSFLISRAEKKWDLSFNSWKYFTKASWQEWKTRSS